MYMINAGETMEEFYLFGFGPWHIPEYAHDERKALKFKTKAEAQKFAKVNGIRRAGFTKLK